MEELAKSITGAIEPNSSDFRSSAEILRDAAVKWSEHSLTTYRGALLQLALDISLSLAEFSNWFDAEKE